MIPEIWGPANNCFSFWVIFCPFTLLTTQKMRTLEKLNNTPGGLTISHLCTTNDNHMIYGSCDMEHDRQNFAFLPP